MSRHRRPVKARTRGPAARDPRHRRPVEPDSTAAVVAFDPTGKAPDDDDAHDQTDADSQAGRAGYEKVRAVDHGIT
jgi:hypothetical protein